MAVSPDPNPGKESSYSGTSKAASDAVPATGSTRIGWRRSAANQITYLFAAGVCFLFFTVLAMIQPPRGVPHPVATLKDYGFWAYPIVVNDIKRLQRVTVSGASKDSTLNAVWISGDHVWIAGDNGILLHSPDSGTTWRKLPESGDPNVQTNQSRSWIHLATVQAAARDALQQGSSSANPSNNRQSGSSTNTKTPPATSQQDNGSNPPPSALGNNPNRAVQPAANAPYRPTGTTPNQQGGATQSLPAQTKPNGATVNPSRIAPNTRPPGLSPASKTKAALAADSPSKGQQSRHCSVVGVSLTAVYFADEQRGYVRLGAPGQASPSNDVCTTNNKAETWTYLDPAPSSTEQELLNDLSLSASSAVSLTNGYQVLLDPKAGIITKRGAESYTGPFHGAANLKAIQFGNDDRVGFAVGTSGTVIKTTNGGRTWFPVLQGVEGEQLGNRQPHKFPAPWYYLSWIMVALIAAPALKKPTDAELLGKETIADIGISDRPLEPGDPDPLGYRELALSISRFLRNENTIAPITIAITGDWGTGKSSIMNLLRRDLSSRGLQSIWFNAWHNQTEDDLFATILQAVRKQGVPQWWELDYLPFRLRLLWIRWRSRWQSITLLLMAMALLTGIEWKHRSQGDHTISGFFDSFKNWQSFISGLQNLSHDTIWVLVICILYAGKHLYDGLKAFGVDPASLLASRSGTTKLPDLEKQTSLRQSFAQELREVTQALGKRRRMVMFIDDLDRCMPDNIRVVLEAVNFIVTSGECFVIMGLARRPVEAGIGLSFEQIADEMTWSTVSEEGDPEKLAKRKRWEFSRQYLDKLINIEIPARPISAARYEDLVLQNVRPVQPTDLVSYITTHGLKILLPVLVSVLLIVSMASVGMWIGAQKQPPPGTSGPKSVDTTIAVQSATQPNISTAGTPPSQQVAAETFSLDPPDKAGISELAYIGAFFGSGLLLYFCWRILTRKEDVIVKDSPKFRQALELWDSVIVLSHDTPRSTKRFMNRLRCLAMRLRPATEEKTRWNILRRREAKPPVTTADSARYVLPESMLVALSALYDIAPEIVRNADLFSNALQGRFESATASNGQEPKPLVAKSLKSLLQFTIKEHKSMFPDEWSPTGDQRMMFLNMSTDVTVRD